MENPQNPLAGRVPDVEPSARVAASTATRPDDATPDWRGRPFLGQPGPLHQCKDRDQPGRRH